MSAPAIAYDRPNGRVLWGLNGRPASRTDADADVTNPTRDRAEEVAIASAAPSPARSRAQSSARSDIHAHNTFARRTLSGQGHHTAGSVRTASVTPLPAASVTRLQFTLG